MKKYKVKTPNDSFNGVRHGVQFYRGEAIAELTKEVIQEFESWGYLVEEIVDKKESPKPKEDKKTKKNGK